MEQGVERSFLCLVFPLKSFQLSFCLFNFGPFSLYTLHCILFLISSNATHQSSSQTTFSLSLFLSFSLGFIYLNGSLDTNITAIIGPSISGGKHLFNEVNEEHRIEGSEVRVCVWERERERERERQCMMLTSIFTCVMAHYLIIYLSFYHEF